LNRRWKSGDVIELELPMPVRRVLAAEEVEADRGRVALQRGPIVYCTESPDNPQLGITDMALAREATFKTEYRSDMLNGTLVIKGVAAHKSSDGRTIAEKEFTAIPYHAWANRGDSKMIVWMQDAIA
ncbi:MAG: glycoside hydrolase family 127 protein, partial [Acidobacteriaceae bacterium]|nr:glycoside hydrolase family 127 protein [Acidobacteriaceae bacterium]